MGNTTGDQANQGEPGQAPSPHRRKGQGSMRFWLTSPVWLPLYFLFYVTGMFSFALFYVVAKLAGLSPIRWKEWLP